VPRRRGKIGPPPAGVGKKHRVRPRDDVAHHFSKPSSNSSSSSRSRSNSRSRSCSHRGFPRCRVPVAQRCKHPRHRQLHAQTIAGSSSSSCSCRLLERHQAQLARQPGAPLRRKLPGPRAPAVRLARFARHSGRAGRRLQLAAPRAAAPPGQATAPRRPPWRSAAAPRALKLLRLLPHPPPAAGGRPSRQSGR